LQYLLVAGKTDQLRAQLGNSIAMKAFKDKPLPFPDGAIIAAIHDGGADSGTEARDGAIQAGPANCVGSQCSN
jgi:hypothetical protein